MRKINVDIYYDVARSVMVEAEDEDDAVRIVEEKLRNGDIDLSTFEPTGDYDFVTDWQPEECDIEEYYKTHKV